MKLTLGQARLVTGVLALLTLVLFPLASALRSEGVLYAALLCFVLTVLVWFACNRCPRCRRHLGRSTSLYCPHCKERL
ncbi:MAG: hypothetical protein HFF65_07425 [Oscillospiraceae bacterium]|nr:hypothetical protein [Oscillospiraceae bacterium]MCI9392215.1 hypothetical protein [Oscillospiraceae bacterium]